MEIYLKFTELGLSEDILSAVSKAGYETPTPIQEQTIMLALDGKDVIGQAQTGTGKTAAFGLPTLDKIDINGGLQALVIAPTRELAVQSQEELFRFGRDKGVKVRSVFGDVLFSPLLKNGKIANSKNFLQLHFLSGLKTNDFPNITSELIFLPKFYSISFH